MARRKAPPKKRAGGADHLARLETALEKVLDVLQEARVPFALIGGLAVSARAAPRFTADIDFAIACDELAAEQLVFAFGNAGFEIVAVLEDKKTGALATVRLKEARSPLLVDLLFRFVGIEREIVEGATPVPILGRLRAPVASVAHLLAMKIQAARPKDLADLDALGAAADAPTRKSALEAAARMIALGTNEGRDLVAELERVFEARRRRVSAARRWRRRR